MKVKLKRTSPTYHRSLSTATIMRDLLIGLLVIAIYSVIHFALTKGSAYALKDISMFVTSVVCALAVEGIWGSLHKRSFKDVFNTSFPLITPIIYTLTLPIGTPLYVVAIGALIATFFGKLVYGGFGNNIFNPALVGRVVVHLSFASKLTNSLASDIDGVSAPTPAAMLASTSWQGGKNFVYTLSDLFFGNHAGAIGETCVCLIIIVGIVLAFRHVYDARITASYLGMVAILAFAAGIVFGLNPLHYAAIHLCLGGLMFGAFFMATDPVTSPVSPLGKIIFGMSLGFLTMLIRLKANYPEGVLFSILMMNMLTPLIDSLIVGRTSENTNKQLGVIGGMAVLFVVIIAGVSATLM